MTTTTKLNLLAGLMLAVSFFLPWLVWKEVVLSGSAMPTGEFFVASKSQFGVDNPLPQFSFVFNIFWLIPAAAVAVIVLTLFRKSVFWPAVVAGLLSLSLVLVSFLFSKSMIDQLGVSQSVWNLVKPWLFVQAAAAVVIVLTAGNDKWLLKSGLVLATALITVVGFNMASKAAEKKIFDETHESTDKLKADYTISASELLKDFLANDSAANKKYSEKVLQVNGNVTAAELASDSTGTIRFDDSTAYAIFSIEKKQYDLMKTIKPGDAVSVKGVCSGGVYSDILSSTSVSFKRSVISKQ